MKIPKGLPDDVVLRTWMAHGKGNDSINSDTNSAGNFVSPILKGNNTAGEVHPRIVTLSLRPFRTTNVSVNSFLAPHSARRNSAKQKLVLKPLSLEQKNCSSNIDMSLSNNASDLHNLSSRGCEKAFHGKSLIDTWTASTRGEKHKVRRQSAASSHLIPINVPAYDFNSRYPKTSTLPDNLYTIQNISLQSPPRTNHKSGQKTTLGNTCNSGFFNVFNGQSGLVATGIRASNIETKQLTKPKLEIVKNNCYEKGHKYQDPILACNPGFQARISEIIQNELDTIKWEKGKKGKKKSAL